MSDRRQPEPTASPTKVAGGGSSPSTCWAVVWRNGKPIAGFMTDGLAKEWIREALHRKNDTIARRHITFKGEHGYPPNAELSRTRGAGDKHIG